MPTYQYACTSCGEELEVVQSMQDDALTQCPACGDGRLRKLFGNVGVVFKGSGFYRTDSRSSGSSGSKAGSSASKDGGSTGGGSTGGGSKDSGSTSSSAGSSGGGTSSTSSGSSSSSSPAA